jgi:hypothetical protein
MIHDTKPIVKLIGQDGNAFGIIGLCLAAARKAGWTKEQTTMIRQEMMSGDYDHLLQTAMIHFDIQ